MYTVYILKSTLDGQLYAGFTTDLQQRLYEHNSGTVPSTRDRKPLQLVFFESYVNKKDALRRERYFKTSAGKKALKFMLRTTLEEGSSFP